MVAAAIHATVRHSHLHRLLQSEGHYRSAWYSYCTAPNFSSIDCAKNSSHDAVVRSRFNSICLCPDSIPLSIDHYRFEIQDQVVVSRYSDDQFGVGAPRNGNSAVVSPHILVDNTVKYAIIRPLHVDWLLRSNRDHSAGLKHCIKTPISIPITVAVAILSKKCRRQIKSQND